VFINNSFLTTITWFSQQSHAAKVQEKVLNIGIVFESPLFVGEVVFSLFITLSPAHVNALLIPVSPKEKGSFLPNYNSLSQWYLNQ